MLKISVVFPVMAVVATAMAYLVPDLFTPYRGAIVPLLTIIMFAMGLTLTLEDFKRVAAKPLAIGVGLALPPELLVGLVLLGSCPGGTASNVISFLARANVALSVSMTMISSVLAVIATPMVTWLLVGQTIPVAIGAMMASLVQIVLVPVLAGLLLNTLFHRQIDRVKPALPAIATTAIVIAIAIIVALNRDDLALAGPLIMVAIVLHNLAGLTGGYFIPRLLGFDRVTARTIAIEVGMQNSGLAAALALNYFSPLAALPGALFSVWHNLSGAVLAGWWARSAPSNPSSHGTATGTPPT